MRSASWTQLGTSIGAAAALLLPAAFVGCGPKNTFVPPPPPKVTVARPVEDKVLDYLEFTGTTQATDRVDIRARVAGYLKEVAFEDGAWVEKGDLLFVIEPAPFEAAMASANAQLEKAQASLKLAEANLRRITPLARQGTVTQQELDVQRAQVATAAADVSAARAAVTQARLNLDYTRIEAPISGRIGRNLVDVGNLIQVEATLLATIENYAPIYAYFSVSESDVLRLMQMRRDAGLSGVKQNPPPIFLGLSNEEGYPHEGRLDFTEVGVDPGTGTQLWRAIFTNNDRSLLPGLFGHLRLPVGRPEPELLITERAIGADQRGQYLLVVNDENKVEYRPVELGISVNGMRVIKKGVKAGEWVVVNGLQRARPGAEVQPQKTEQAVPGASGLAQVAAPQQPRQQSRQTNQQPQSGATAQTAARERSGR
jgi:RND family efflux transporter MFP subunit